MPDWLGLMCTRITVLLGDEPIEYFGATMKRSVDEWRGGVTIFTPTRVVLASVVARPTGADSLEVFSIRRSSLSRLEVSEARDLYAQWPGDWPGPVSIRATYGDGLAIELPGEDLGEEQLEKYLAFVPSLLIDLAAAG